MRPCFKAALFLSFGAFLALGCKSSGGTSSGGGSLSGNGTPADAASALNEQASANAASGQQTGVTSQLRPLGVASLSCSEGGSETLSGSPVLISSQTSGGTITHVWSNVFTHTMTNCVRRGYVINGTFTQSFNDASGASYLTITRTPGSQVSAQGTYTLSGNNIRITGDKLVGVSSCSLGGTVTMTRTYTLDARSAEISVSGNVSLCGTDYSVNKTVSINVTASSD